jgi:hypothetical protein
LHIELTTNGIFEEEAEFDRKLNAKTSNSRETTIGGYCGSANTGHRTRVVQRIKFVLR